MTAGPAITASSIAVRADEIRTRIRRAGGDPDAITLIAVTKGQPDEAVTAALEAGLPDLAENYAQALVARAPLLGREGRWHFLGSVQRNKIKMLAPHVHCWHAVDRAGVGQAIARHRPGAAVMVQVNVSGDLHKFGCRPEDTGTLVDTIRALDLDVRGLMAVGPAGPAEAARPAFRALAEWGRTLGLAELSMGMSDDFEVAVQEGSTMVRIGTALFGPRSGPVPARR